MTDKEANSISRKFRKWLISEATKTSQEDEPTGGDAGDVRRQTQYRDRQSDNKSWGHAAFFGPQSAIEYIKQQWQSYKNEHSDLWNEPERGSEETTPKDNDKV